MSKVEMDKEKKFLVMTAIANEMEKRFHSMKVSAPKYSSKIYGEIQALYEVYFELRGHTGSVNFVAGMGGEVNTVNSIQQMAAELLENKKTDLQRAAESFAKYRTPDINFQKDYIQQSHNGPVTEEEEEIEL